jgi:hypothetical protein
VQPLKWHEEVGEVTFRSTLDDFVFREQCSADQPERAFTRYVMETMETATIAGTGLGRLGLYNATSLQALGYSTFLKPGVKTISRYTLHYINSIARQERYIT